MSLAAMWRDKSDTIDNGFPMKIYFTLSYIEGVFFAVPTDSTYHKYEVEGKFRPLGLKRVEVDTPTYVLYFADTA